MDLKAANAIEARAWIDALCTASIETPAESASKFMNIEGLILLSAGTSSAIRVVEDANGNFVTMEGVLDIKKTIKSLLSTKVTWQGLEFKLENGCLHWVNEHGSIEALDLHGAKVIKTLFFHTFYYIFSLPPFLPTLSLSLHRNCSEVFFSLSLVTPLHLQSVLPLVCDNNDNGVIIL